MLAEGKICRDKKQEARNAHLKICHLPWEEKLVTVLFSNSFFIFDFLTLILYFLKCISYLIQFLEHQFVKINFICERTQNIGGLGAEQQL